MTSFTKMLPLKPSLTTTLKIIRIDSIDHFNTNTDATENLEKLLLKENVLEEINIRAIMTRSFINVVMGSIQQKRSQLKRVYVFQVVYISHALEAPDTNDIELRATSIEDQWANEIEQLDVFEHRLELRDEVTDEINPKVYGSRLFQEWRQQLDLETIDLTGDSDTD